MKRKCTQPVPQNGIITGILLECHLEMLNVTLAQWCAEERLKFPSTHSLPVSPVLALEDTPEYFTALQMSNASPSDLVFGSLTLDAVTVYQSIAHMVCYVDRDGPKSDYPKCDACELPGHKSDQCHPLINYCAAQAMATQYPVMVKWIKATYKKFSLHVRSRTPNKATVNKIVAFLDLPTMEYMPVLDSNTPVSPADDFICRLVSTTRPNTIARLTPRPSHIVIRIGVTPTIQRLLLLSRLLHLVHALSLLMRSVTITHVLIQQGHDILVDYGSPFTTKGTCTCTGLQSYIRVKMRSATGQVAPLPRGRTTAIAHQ
jgi:hypothetical protein